MPKKLAFTSFNLSNTKKIGNMLGALLAAGDIVSLNGELGAGKTTIAKAISTGLGLKSDHYVVSPTFAIINEYHADVKIYHFDFYRLGDPSELDGIGAYEYFQSDGVCLIEWGDKFADALPKERLDVLLEHAGARQRTITFSPHGKRYAKIVDDLKISVENL